MPLVAYNPLPSYERLMSEGMKVLSPERAQHQDIRELHIGLLNMMPDAALEATERQFLRLVAECNQIAQFYVHLFTLDTLPRCDEAREHIDSYYKRFDEVKAMGLDALIITGANVSQPELPKEPFWDPLMDVIDWACKNVSSVLCSCLATHAVMEFAFGQKRSGLPQKRWGVYPHHVSDRSHPLVSDINTRLNIPHSRYNEISRQQFEQAGTHPLIVADDDGSVHLAVSPDGFRVVFMQGHQEYDTISLLKEYKREVLRYFRGDLEDYPPFPANTLGLQARAILDEFRDRASEALEEGREMPPFPEHLLFPALENTWHDSGEAVLNNWLGLVYQVTHVDRHQQYMDGVNPDDPLAWHSGQGL